MGSTVVTSAIDSVEPSSSKVTPLVDDVVEDAVVVSCFDVVCSESSSYSYA